MAVGLSMFLGQLQFLLSVGKQSNTSSGISVSFILQRPLCALALIIHKNLNYTYVYGDFLLPSYVYGTCNVYRAAGIINLFPAVSLLTPIQGSYYRHCLMSFHLYFFVTCFKHASKFPHTPHTPTHTRTHLHTPTHHTPTHTHLHTPHSHTHTHTPTHTHTHTYTHPPTHHTPTHTHTHLHTPTHHTPTHTHTLNIV